MEQSLKIEIIALISAIVLSAVAIVIATLLSHAQL